MRLVLVPLILAAILAVGPTAVHANSNQAAAEKIAAGLGDRFPGYDIAVSYKNGNVRVVGQVGSPEIADQVVEQVKKTPGVKVAAVDSGLRVANMSPQAVVPVKPETNVQPPKTKRSIWAPPQSNQPQIASAPVPMPGRPVMQVSNETEKYSVVPPTQQPNGQNGAAPLQHPPITPQQLQMMQQQQQPMMMPPQSMMQQPMPPQQMMVMQQPMMPPQDAYHPEAYGPQGPMPGQYNHPNLPDYAWPSYACYPNYAEVCYPKQYSPKAWPHIGPFYPYPQTPLGWRKVTLEHHDGWWWLDFDDGTPSGPFSPLFRQPVRYTY